MKLVKPIERTKPQLTVRKSASISSKGKRIGHPKWSDTPFAFVGIDGEGVTFIDEQGEKEHRYVFIRLGNEQPLENPNGLEWKEVFDYLYRHRKPRTVYVGFFLGYDFDQILKTLSEERARRLFTKDGRVSRERWRKQPEKRIQRSAPFPVDCDEWEFDILPPKRRLKIRPKGSKQPWMHINDAGPFFQTSFLSIIEPTEKKWPNGAIVTQEEYDKIKRGKENRADATIVDDEMREYNALENEVMARLMTVMDAGLQSIGIRLQPDQWFGPGQAAQQWMKNKGISTGEEIRECVPIEFLEAARMSYFGGWYEIMMHGIIPGDTYEYDINSAYPYIIANLPCLLHGKHSTGNGEPRVRNRDICFVKAVVNRPQSDSQWQGQYIGTMLHRNANGSILRPSKTAGWYWWNELKAAQACGLLEYDVLEWMKYVPCKCEPPLKDIADLYNERKRDNNKNTPKGKAIKLICNSAYGKFAQSIGNPMYSNSVYASLITAGCRTMILNAIATHPKGAEAVAMVATDAVYFLSEHPSLPLSEELGEWERTIKRNLTLFKPGVYWDNATRDDIKAERAFTFKARGFNAKDFKTSIDTIDKEYRRWPNIPEPTREWQWPSVTFKSSFAVVSSAQALQRNNWELAGKLIDNQEITQNSNPIRKRIAIYQDEYYDGRKIYRSFPHLRGFKGDESTPYDKHFGMEDEDNPLSEINREHFGINQDGPVGVHIVQMLTQRA